MQALALYACSELFGAKFIEFPNKKAVRKSAAMEAIQFLIEQGLVDLESQDVKIAEKSKAKLEAISNRPFYVQKINNLPFFLSFQPPQYQIVPNLYALRGNILSEVAYF